MVIGITGAIGSGKSFVAKIFANNGYYIIDCDNVSHSIDNNENYLKGIINTFGESVLTDGKLDRKKLARIVFKSKEKLKQLESISYPIIFDEIFKLQKEAEDKGLICIYDAPTLFESGLDKYCDITIGVIADKDIRIERAIKRGGIDENDLRSRALIQPDSDFYKNRCTYIVDNNGTEQELLDNVNKLIKNIKNKGVKKWQRKKNQ